MSSNIDWDRFLFNCSRLVAEGTKLLEKEFNSPQDAKSFILKELNMADSYIESPVFGSLFVRIANQKTSHSNISTSIKPTYDDGWSNQSLLNSMGVEDKNGHERSLMNSIPHKENKKSSNLWLTFTSDDIFFESNLGRIGKWDKKNVIAKLTSKANNVLIKYEMARQEIRVISIQIVVLNKEKLDYDFVSLVKSGDLTCECRMYVATNHQHCISRGYKPGSIRNHGYGWRMKASLQNTIFDVIDLV